MIKLKQIDKLLEDFFSYHQQIKATLSLNDKSFIGKRDKIYPLANHYFVDSSIANKFLNYNYIITLADLLNANQSNDRDIYNNMLLVAEDFFTWLNSFENIIFNKQSSIQTFIESDGDRCAGITFRISLSVIRSQNECVIPLSLT